MIPRVCLGVWLGLVSALALVASEPAPAGANTAAGRSFWSFQPVSRPKVPSSPGHPARPENPIDAFMLEKLRSNHLEPAPPAPPIDLIRRVTFDLTGLPPTPEEVEAYAADPSPQAFDALVDRLLASPHFGERAAQHWLDVVRYAETEGFEYDRHLPEAWRYRDYVIRAFQEDKPFDRFVHEQIAGDEDPVAFPEGPTAAILHRLGPVRRNAGNPEIALSRNEVLTERTDVLGAAFLGLTVGCARCHDHKLDPISQKDYYRLQAYFAATDEHDLVLLPEAQKVAWESRTKELNAEIRELRKAANAAEGEARVKLNKQVEALEATLPPQPPTIPSIHNDPTNRTAIHVLKRGEWEKKGEPVGPRPPSVVVAESWPELASDTAKPRTELARWLTDPANPLVARVIVNRLWQQHFGTGLVKTPNDFGSHGERPSHPELLDWLAAELVANGWRLKPLHRLMVTSQAYRQSSQAPAAERLDPENRWLARFSARRLSAEEIRDAMLAVSGRLNPRQGGASVMVPADQELVALLYKPAQWEPARDVREHDRRSIYLIAKRNLRLPFMETFDQPALLSSCGRRESSTHAPQALELLNGRLSNDLAAAFADRLRRECGEDHARLAERAFRLALGRGPSPREQQLARQFLASEPLPEFALSLFNLNSFLYVQ